MTREDALYFKLLLQAGFWDSYEEWLNRYLITQEPLSDLTMELSYCVSDAEKTISLLHAYCGDLPVDKDAVCEKLRLFLKDAFGTNRLTAEETTTLLYRFSLGIDTPVNSDSALWWTMYLLDDARISMEPSTFRERFTAYLEHGIPFELSKK